jgi:hypothetical protein
MASDSVTLPIDPTGGTVHRARHDDPCVPESWLLHYVCLYMEREINLPSIVAT